MNIRIEKANERHGLDIERLSDELGYKTSLEKVLKNMENIRKINGHEVWVALENNAVLGWCHAGITYWVMMESMVEVFGLVVSSTVRGRGIGKLLIEQVENFAKDLEISEVWIRSNRIRKESHPFYLRLGYANIKDQAVYVKQVIR